MTLHLSPRKNPLILIIGATGTGKSNLAVQIAQYLSRPPPQPQPKFTHNDNHDDVVHGGAEIINADAMQLYRGLPIITNKITVAEQRGIPHHLLGHIGLEEEPWTVQHFVKEADRAIGQIRRRGNVPIVVGGTSYYVHGLLFRDAVLEPTDDGDSRDVLEDASAVEGFDARVSADDKSTGNEFHALSASTEEIYAKLKDIDPDMARRWHPNDRKKIQRSLEIYLKTGRKASEIYKAQRENIETGSTMDRPQSASEGHDLLRYDPIIFWLESEDKILKERLNVRVDKMVLDGLLDEAQEMGRIEKKLEKENTAIDKSMGIWVSIGYKEMEPWLQAQDRNDMQDKEVAKLKNLCIEAVKGGTRRYAKRQNRYIRIRLANALAHAQSNHKLFLLDCTNLDKWQENVQTPAEMLVRSFLLNQPLPAPAVMNELAQNTFANMNEDADGEQRFGRRCDACDKILMTAKEWVGHINSRHHKRVLQSIRKAEQKQSRQDTPRLTAEVEAG